jgi:hypothetical protein
MKALLFAALQPDTTSDGPFVKQSNLADLDEERERIAGGGGIRVGSQLLLHACRRFPEHAGAAVQPA